MKQKLFTLLTLLLVGISSAWATDVEIVKFVGSTGNLGITIGGSTAFGTVKINSNTNSVNCMQLKNGYTVSESVPNNYIKLTIEGGFKTGDVVSITGCYNNSSTKNAKADLFTVTGTTTSSILFSTSLLINGRSTSDSPEAETYTLLADADELYVGRNNSISSATTTCITGLTVTRDLSAPLITTQPVSADYAVGESATALTVAAIASTGDLSYQWYKNTDGDTSAKVGDKIDGATSATLATGSISTAAAGTFYYYCVVGDGSANKTTSSKATITVTQTYTVTYKANGSGEDDVIDNDATTVAANPFTYDDHVFTGWNTDAGGGGTAYAVGDAVTGNLTLFAQWAATYTITKGSHTNGDFSIDKTSAAAGETVTLTATPDFKYVLDSWSVYKTGEPGTTVTVTSNQFTMPAYAVTVDATFTDDARKQILYLTTTAKATTEANDKLYAALNSVDDYNVIIEAPASQTLTDYDLIVLHESIGGTSDATAVTGCKTTATPVLNTKSYFYGADGDASKRWQWGAPNAGKSVKGATLSTIISNIASHPLFSNGVVSTNFVEITDAAEAKCMQPVGSFVNGKEGYVLATTDNASSGIGAAIHELTPAQRGVASGKYLLISVSSAKLNALNTNGQQLFKNAAAYLMGATSFAPTYVTTTVTTNKGKWASFTPSWNATLESGAKAYYVTAVTSTTITATAVDVLKAGQGYFIKGEAASTGYTVTATDVNANATTGTLMVGQLSSTTINATTPDSNDKFVLGTTAGGTSGLFKVNSDVTVAAGKAYLNSGTTGLANSLNIDFEDGAATGIQTIEAQKELLEGDFYNLKGQKVLNPTQGLYIVNGRKVVIR